MEKLSRERICFKEGKQAFQNACRAHEKKQADAGLPDGHGSTVQPTVLKLKKNKPGNISSESFQNPHTISLSCDTARREKRLINLPMGCTLGKQHRVNPLSCRYGPERQVKTERDLTVAESSMPKEEKLGAGLPRAGTK